MAFDQNKDGVVSEEEAKFFLHMEKEMEKSVFLATGWMLVKPYFLKEQNQFKPPSSSPPSQSEELPTHDEVPHDFSEDSHVIYFWFYISVIIYVFNAVTCCSCFCLG